MKIYRNKFELFMALWMIFDIFALAFVYVWFFSKID